ncbi:DUF447 domain-containing protein [uncultured Lamprocystis sp.]|uniref:DUF447 domain-containing protein n=1 Tax=uncultured Lamprocystis sp. TaxID=543132 RepID=UPI0025E6338F|nr:DUF447 domain-containing protein [uncultured Lamprocystis sp.]
MIEEVIVTTRAPGGLVHIAPMGIRQQDGLIIIAPFRPSTTLDNVLAGGCAVINYTDDVRIFAGCICGRQDWPVTAAQRVAAPRLADTLAHTEVELLSVEDDPVRPRLFCRPVHQETHHPFQGFNRAQAAVLELAILASRLDRLPADKIAHEVGYLRIAIDKTAGPRELLAWGWLMERIATHQAAATDGAIRS